MTVDEIYLNIGQSLATSIDENWSDAKLEIEIVANGVVGYTGEYNNAGKINNISLKKIPREIRHWIRELHEITTEGENNKWNRAVFMLTPDGKFDMEFKWDQELQDEIERLAKG